MALILISTVLLFLENQEYLTSRMARRFEDETRRELEDLNQPVSPQLEALLACIRNPHPLTTHEKREIFHTLITFVNTLENNPALGVFDLGEVYGSFGRETNGVIHAFREQPLPTSILINKVLVFTLLISTGKINNFDELYNIYRVMTLSMSQSQPTIIPLLELLTEQQVAPPVEKLLDVFQQIYVGETCQG